MADSRFTVPLSDLEAARVPREQQVEEREPVQPVPVTTDEEQRRRHDLRASGGPV